MGTAVPTMEKRVKNRIGKIEIAGQIIDREAMELARQQWDSVAKPLNSLGKLEDLIIQIAGIQKTPHVNLQKKEVLVYCADNGAVAEGISQSDSSVTSMVAHSMAEGRANINIMAGQAGAKVTPVDVGMKDVVNHAGLIQHKIMPGTRNFAKEPAMSAEQCQQAIMAGIELVGQKAAEGVNIIAIGEMGIGNTTTSSAVASVLLDRPVEEMTGKGAGLSSEGLIHKKQIIEQAISRYHLREADAFYTLCKVGGLDIAGMAGVFIGGAALGMPVVMDGFISCVSALIAIKICPQVSDHIIASHVSKEPAAHLILKELGKEAIIHAGMCLGEGTGAVALFPMMDLSCAVYNSMSTFGDINVEQYEELK